MSFGIPVRNGLMLGVSTYVALSARRAFSPAALFAAGEPGAWYDPSDFSTLFQDSAGTTPVTAVAQQVGLMLDKSQGLVLGPELVTNGDFSGGTTGWTASAGGTLTASSGDLTLTTSSGFITLTPSSAIPTVAGRTYRVNFTVVSNNTSPSSLGNIRVGTFSSGSDLYNGNATIVNAPRSYSFVFTATTTTSFLWFQTGNAAGALVFDDISIKLLPGNHAFQSNSGQRPTLGRNPTTGRLNLLTFTEEFNNAVWSTTDASVTANAGVAPDGTSTADKLSETATTARHFLSTVAAVIPSAATYNVSVYAKAVERSRFNIIASGGTPDWAWFDLSAVTATVGSGTGAATITAVGNGWYRCTFTIVAAAAGAVQFNLMDNVVLPARLPSYAGTAGSGILIWGAQLQTDSTATAYQRVVSSFDVTEAGKPDLYYVNFDGTDDGMLTNTITPGIDKAQVFTGVRKLTDGGDQIIIESSANLNSNNGTFYVSGSISGAAVHAFANKGSLPTFGSVATASGLAAPLTSVLTGIGDIAADTTILRRNGAQVASSANDLGTGNYLAYPLYLGRRGGTVLPFNGNIYSMIVRFGANLTADQIAATETWVNGKTGAF